MGIKVCALVLLSGEKDIHELKMNEKLKRKKKKKGILKSRGK